MVFLVNLPIGIAAIFLTPLVLADVRSGERKRLDVAGVALSTLAMLLLMLPLVEGPERGWSGWPIAMLTASPAARESNEDCLIVGHGKCLLQPVIHRMGKHHYRDSIG
jgi:hypothetical protein